MIRIGAALFNGNHARLGEEVARTEAAGIDFFHLDVFDGYFVPEQAFAARSIKTLRKLTGLPFEIHLAVQNPMPFLEPLKDAGAGLIFLPAESTGLLYETIYAVREHGMKAGLCLALGTPLSLLKAVLPMLDSVLLVGRITGEGDRGRDFNQLVIARVEEARRMIEEAEVKVDLQAAGGLETDSCIEVCRAGATSLPLGKALYREADMAAYLLHLRSEINTVAVEKVSVSPNLNLESNGPAGGTRKRSSKFKVLIASRSFGKNCPEVLEKMTSEGCQFLPRFDRTPKEEELMEQIAQADALISGTEPVTARVLAAAPNLKVISKHGVGTDNIDLEAAKARSIVVTVAGGAVVDSVADLTLALLLSMARQIPQALSSVRSGQWDRFVGPELRGKILGIVGLGRIGKAVGCRARSFGMRLMAFDAHPDLIYGASWGVQFVSLQEVFSNSDFITLHAPLNASTKLLVKGPLLSSMRPTAYLINTSRGELVDETALYEALQGGKIAGAATDVFAQEPPPANHPLLTLNNFIATPHCGSQTHEALRRMGEVTAENTLRVLRGEKALFEA